jgi:hypothetical protein
MTTKQKSSVSVGDDGAFILTVNWSDGVTDKFNGNELTPTMRGFLAVSRLHAKLHDAHAGETDAVKSRKLSHEVWDSLLAGVWDRRGTGERREKILDISWDRYLDALMAAPKVVAVFGKDRAKCAKFFAQYAPKGEDGRKDSAKLRQVLEVPGVREYLENAGLLSAKKAPDVLGALDQLAAEFAKSEKNK